VPYLCRNFRLGADFFRGGLFPLIAPVMLEDLMTPRLLGGHLRHIRDLHGEKPVHRDRDRLGSVSERRC
jgi:hypothetical protein